MKIDKKDLTPENILESFKDTIHNEYLGKGTVEAVSWTFNTKCLMENKDKDIDLCDIAISATITGLVNKDGEAFTSVAKLKCVGWCDYQHYPVKTAPSAPATALVDAYLGNNDW